MEGNLASMGDHTADRNGSRGNRADKAERSRNFSNPYTTWKKWSHSDVLSHCMLVKRLLVEKF